MADEILGWVSRDTNKGPDVAGIIRDWLISFTTSKTRLKCTSIKAFFLSLTLNKKPLKRGGPRSVQVLSEPPPWAP